MIIWSDFRLKPKSVIFCQYGNSPLWKKSTWRYYFLRFQVNQYILLNTGKTDVVPLSMMHRLGSIWKTIYSDPFESRIRIFIPAKYDQFWRKSEIWQNFKWLLTFFLFGIRLMDIQLLCCQLFIPNIIKTFVQRNYLDVP